MPSNLTRRAFTILAAGAATAIRAASTPQKVIVRANVPIATIRPDLHGHFAEHLGSCTYGGLWVGPKSDIPNISGYRKQAVEWLKALGIPNLRWPGGCFADDYHWRDGIGPVEKRPKTVNIWWGNYTEDNSFGTHEFLGLCRLIGAEPYLAGNVGSGTPEELRDWVEYCNFPSGSTLSDQRAANGSPEPFKVRYWGVGNENWGCGGNFTPAEYAMQYRRFATFMKAYGGIRPFLIACGPNGNDVNWTRGFFEAMRGRNYPQGYSMHFYSNGKAYATNFNVEQLQEQLSSFERMEKGIIQQRALMDSYDPDRKVALFLDEWGVWDRISPEDTKRYGALFQPITMRSAVAAALGLCVFQRQADKLYMGNIAQIVNVLHSMLLTDGPKCIRTTSYWAFDMMKDHRGNTAVRAEVDNPSALGLSMSASRQERDLVLTFVNPSHDTPMDLDCTLDGIKPGAVSARVLQHADFNAANTFDQPDLIIPRAFQAKLDGQRVLATLPPLGIVTMNVTAV